MGKPTLKLARKYDKRLQFFFASLVDDGFGGKEPGLYQSFGSRWAYVVNQSERSLSEYRERYGLNEQTVLKIFVIRYWNSFSRQIDTFEYLGVVYNILIVNEASEYATDMEIVAIKVEGKKIVPVFDDVRQFEDGFFRLLESAP